MCSVCGCGHGETRIEGEPAARHGDHVHDHAHGHGHAHDHRARVGHASARAGAAPPHSASPHDVGSVTGSRLVRVERDILAKNRSFAEANRSRLAEHGVFALNLMSSPGAGKTTLLTATIRALKDAFPIAVIEGDQETANDADRIRETGAPAVQINTGRGCHLDAHMVGHALDRLPLAEGGVLFIENVGNLVCPAAFDLGEARKVALLSVAEGDDKPIKYPEMFMAADLMVLTKIDLLPHVDFDVARAIEHARCVNANIGVLQLSARTGEGIAAWLGWIRNATRPLFEHRAASLERALAASRGRVGAAE